METYDVLIIGGGAAGLSAALVLTRARRSVLVVDGGAPRNAPAAHMHGFLSRDGLPPGEFLEAGRAEVVGYGGTVRHGEARELIRCGSSRFQALLADGARVAARRVLVATGLRDELPDVPGLRERWGRDVLHCPYCHGYEVRDRAVGVLGRTADHVHYAQLVRQWARDVVLFVPAGTLTPAHRAQLTARAVGIVEAEVTGLVVEDDRLRGVGTDDGRTVPRDVLFVPPQFVAHDALLRGVGCAVGDDGWIVTGPGGATTVPGVRAAGNVANPRAQVVTAAGEGSAAAIAINADLVEEDVREAVEAFGHGFALPDVRRGA